jgi:hypothetical protein
MKESGQGAHSKDARHRLVTGAGEAADAGMDAYASVTDDHDPWDNAFTGTINSVKVAHKA